MLLRERTKAQTGVLNHELFISYLPAPTSSGDKSRSLASITSFEAKQAYLDEDPSSPTALLKKSFGSSEPA